MRVLLIVIAASLVYSSCSSTKIVPATTAGTAAPPPVSAIPPAVERLYQKINYADSSSTGSISIKPQDGYLLVLEHITVTGKFAEGQGAPVIRLTVWPTGGESMEHILKFAVKDGYYIYDNDVFHRLQPGQQAAIDIFNPESGDVFPATIKTSGYQETK